ncbi:MAG: hypothetical protein P1P82_17205 [Bacteroidales bacterium]|nr:hypothetical protein [Bacteroidales bacterium]MDT8432337.1 hypothetical protein [Bacteroidales bacterium]
MIRTNFTKAWVAIFAVATISMGCNKENDDTPPAEQLSFNTREVMDKLPQGLINSDDEYAQQCVDDIESALDMSTFMDNMVPPEDAVKTSKKAVSGDTWSWNVTYGDMSYTFYWSYEEDNAKRYWTMDIQFNDGERYSYISAWESKDGKNGEVIYNFNWVDAYEGSTDYEDLYWRYSWTLDDDGNYEFGWDYDSNTEEYDYFLKYTVVVNADGSGYIDYYSMDVQFYHMEWDAMGNGSWTYFYGEEFTQSGSWSV